MSFTVRTRSDYERFCRMVAVLEHIVKQELFLSAEQSFYCKDCLYQNACPATDHHLQFAGRSRSNRPKARSMADLLFPCRSEW